MKKIIFPCFVFWFVFLLSCSGGGGGSYSNYPRFDSDDNTIVQFVFPASKNPSLAGDVSGDISENSISLMVPYNTDVNALIAEFVTNAGTVEVNGSAQQSGVTANDFSTPATYNVTAENGESRSYTVTVTKAPSTEKSMVSFSLSGTEGSIDDDNGTILVELPPKTSITSLIASFSTTGILVSANGEEQESGTTAHDFSNPVVYTVKAEDSSTKIYTVTASVLPATWKEITFFAFYKDLNSSLSGDATGSISDDSIDVILPYGSSPDSLKATFETNGESVTVDGAEQTSNETVNDFTEPLTCRVTAEDGSTKDYTVTVTVAKNDAKAITSFSLKGEAGEINEDTGAITVDLPVNAIVTGLTASFIATGVSVDISGTAQESGVTANDFTSPVAYTVTAEDGSTKNYTVTAVKNEDITGLWNFEDDTDGSYTVFEAETVNGILGEALFFDGYNDYVTVPDSEVLTMAHAGTIEALIYINEYTPFAGIVHKGVDPDFSDEAFSLQFWYGGTVRIGLFNDSGGYDYVDSTFELDTETWYYLAATWDAASIMLYINGSLDVSGSNDIGPIRDTDGDLVIGAQLADEYINSSWRNLGFSGIIDRVQLHGKALTADEISRRYSDMESDSGGALAAYLLSAVKTRGEIIALLLVLVVIILAGLYARNRKRARNT